MISQSSNQQRVINCTLVSQRPDVMWVWQVDRIKTIPSDCWCGQVRVCLCVCFFWVHRKPSGSGASHGTVPACRIRTGRSWIQITAHTHKHTQYHLRLTHTHTHPHTCSSITQMLWENALIATCSCQSNFFLFVLSIFFFFFYVQSQPGQQRNPPPSLPPAPWRQPRSIWRSAKIFNSLRLAGRLTQHDNVVQQRWKTTTDVMFRASDVWTKWSCTGQRQFCEDEDVFCENLITNHISEEIKLNDIIFCLFCCHGFICNWIVCEISAQLKGRNRSCKNVVLIKWVK